MTSETNPDFDFRFSYTGREQDDATGLMSYRARYYDPAVGRFLSEDPIGFDAGDANLYRYVFNSPTNYTDPSGNAAFPVIPIIIGGIVAPFIGDALWSPVQTPETCNDISPGLPWYLRIPAEVALGAGIGAAPGLARGLGRSIAQQLPQLLDDVARGVGSIGDDVGRALAGSGDELVPALPGGGRLPAGAIDDLNPAAPLRSQGNPGGAGDDLVRSNVPGSSSGNSSDIPWSTWDQYPKVTRGGREYAQVGDRLYPQHAIDRTTPSGLGRAAGGDRGRSISPSYVEEIITSPTSKRKPVTGPRGEPRTSIRSGSVEVITEANDEIVITIITH